ncbi:MAG: hypothetical protein KAH23_10095, partial [Kiritimatiellae bacterium]|nr:hypothetical protein [Kiritimatiellia bacterium]
MNVEASQKRKGFLCLALIAVGMTVANVQSATYPDMPYTGPSPMPEFPAGFPAFDPPVTNLAPAADAPAIAEWTRSNEPGDTMILTGEDLTSQTGNSMGRDTRFVTYGVGSKVNDAFIQRLDGRMAALTLSSSLPFDEMYLMWPKNGIGYGKPVAINQTEAWWVGPNKVSKGDTFSVYGRNLQLGSDDCYLYIEELGLWLISDSANPYKADFILPHDIENGTYTLWVHNGKGREYGWAGSLRLTIEGVRLWNDDPDTWIDVTAAPYNAIGDGLANDHDAIRDAINDAKDGAYETVYLPAGTYAIDEQLIPRDDIRVIGDGMDRSIITTHSNFTGYGLCFSGFASSGPTEIWNLTLDAGDYLQNGLANKSLFDFAGGFSDLSFHNVSFDASDIAISESGGGIVLTGADNISFTGCKFITETSLNVAGGSRQIFIKDCDFYGINDAMFLVNVGSGREVSITGCTAQDFDNSNVNDGHGWAHGRFVTGNASASGIHKIYYGGNSTTNMMVRPAVSNQNTGETYMMEHGHIKYRSAPSFVTSNTASFASLATDYTGEIVAVVDG